MNPLARLLLALICGLPCLAQPWEAGVGAGYGSYRSASVWAPAGVATAGFRNRFVVTAVLGEDLYPRISGELRYAFQDGDPFLRAASIETNLQGQSHALSYDVLLHLRPESARFRPYFAAGLGAKLYRVTGPETPTQPLGAIARLRSVDQLEPLVVGGGGVKIRVSGKILLRFDFLDYVTPFPKKLIQPAAFATARGLFQQFTPSAGISLVF